MFTNDHIATLYLPHIENDHDLPCNSERLRDDAGIRVRTMRFGSRYVVIAVAEGGLITCRV